MYYTYVGPKHDSVRHDTSAKALLCKLTEKYEELLDNLKHTFKNIRYPVEELIKSFHNADTEKFSHFSDPVVYETVHSIEDLFEMIQRTFKFYDYSALQFIVEISQCKEARNMMDKYKNEIDDVLISCLNLEQTEENRNDRSKLVALFETEKMPVEKLNFITKALEVCLDLPPGSFLLINNREGSVILVYEILPKVKNYLMNLTINTHEIKFLATLKVKSLTIDNEKELLNCDTQVTSCGLYV